MPIEDWEVCGVYCADFGDAERDCFDLRADSTYLHYFRSGSVVRVDTGQWIYSVPYAPQYYVDLLALRIRHPQLSGDPLNARCYLKPPNGVLDTSIVDTTMIRLYRDRHGISMEYCIYYFQEYDQVDSALAAAIRDEFRPQEP